MKRKHLVKGIALVLATSTIATAFPAVAMAAEETAVVADMNMADAAMSEAAPAPEASTPEETPAETPAEVLPVKVKGDDKPAADGSADRVHPIYTEHVTIENGTLAEDFSENDIEFTGIFKNAAIQNITVDEGRTGFTLVFTKEYAEETKYFEGGMTVKGRAVLNSAGENSQTDFSVYLYDAYRAAEEEKAEIDDHMADKEFENTMRIITNAGLDLAMTGFFGTIVPGPFVGRLTKFAGDMGVSWSASQANAAMDSSQEQLKEIKALSSQLSQATFSILKGVDYGQLQNTASAIDSKVALVKADYTDYLNTMNGLYAKAQAGTLANNTTYLDGRMEAVYKYGNGNAHIAKADMANFTCYNHLYDMGEMMLGHGLFGSKDIFQIYQGIASNKYNYNTMSFADRREYNANVVNFYEQGYTALCTAISYDVEKNTALKDEYTKELEELEKLSKKKLSDCAKKTLAAKMVEVEAARDNAKDAVDSGNERLAKLEAQRACLLNAKQASDTIIDTEEAAPYVLCYCNNVKYDRNLTVCASTPENFPVKGAFANANINDFVTLKSGGQGTMGGYAGYVGWEPKAEWQGKKDNNCSGADAFKNSIVYKCDQTGDLNYLDKIAHEKGHTLAQELGEAFQYQGKSAAAALAEGAADGYYNGGNFSITEEFFKNRYCYEKTVFYFFYDFTKATYYDYNWVKFNHNVNYIDGDGNAKTNVETRKFALTKERTMYGSDLPGEADLHKEEAFDGTGVNLFLVNCYEV